MDKLTIPAGTLIKIGGLPFYTVHETELAGSAANLELAMQSGDEVAPVEAGASR